MYGFQFLLGKGIELASTIILFLLFVYGLICWGSNLPKKSRMDYYMPVVVIFGLLFISPLVPYINYNQGYFETLISEREIFIWAYLVLFCKMRVTEKEMIYSLRMISYLCFIYWVISIFAPHLFVDVSSRTNLSYIRRISTIKDMGTYVPGFGFAVFYALYCIHRFLVTSKTSHFIETVFFVIFILLYQNRSTIIIILLSFGYCVIKSKVTKTAKSLLILLPILFFLLPTILYLVESLIDESQSQLADTSYNRWKAIDVYLLERSYTPLNLLLGNCIPSSSGLYVRQMSYYNSTGAICADVGTIATLYYYGIFPIVLLIYWSYLSFKKGIPLYLRFYSIFIWLVPTIHCFMHPYSYSNIVFVVYVYLILYYKNTKSVIYGRFISYYCKLQYLRSYREMLKKYRKIY